MLLWFCGLLHGLYFWQLRGIAGDLLISVGSEGRHFLNSNPSGMAASRTSSASFSWLELSFWTSARLWKCPSLSVHFGPFRPLPVPVAYSGGTEEKIPAALPPRTCGISAHESSKGLPMIAMSSHSCALHQMHSGGLADTLRHWQTKHCRTCFLVVSSNIKPV